MFRKSLEEELQKTTELENEVSAITQDIASHKRKSNAAEIGGLKQIVQELQESKQQMESDLLKHVNYPRLGELT